MTFAQAEAYLASTIDEARSPRGLSGLERMVALARELRDPQRAYPTLHIGGTSGKGSTSMLIAAALQASGKRAGLHAKPHLRCVTERACVGGEPISEARFAELLQEMLPGIERVAERFGRPTYYETTLALAFLHFARERVDVAVVEVGLGGRLDGTNILTPVVSVITSIGFDHMEVLGNSLAAIAAEKAGIAKPGVPLIVGADDRSAFDAIAARAASVGAPMVDAHDAQIDVLPNTRIGQRFDVTTARARYALTLPVLGVFQRRNAAAAILALENLPDSLCPSVADVEAGFARVQIAGRMEFFPGDPAVIFDIAHNASKAESLAASLRETFPDRRLRFVVAIGVSKNAREIIRALAGFQARWYMTTFQTQGRRSIAPLELAQVARGFGLDADAIDDPVAAFREACAACAPDEIVVVTGSTFIVSELRERWVDHRSDRVVAQF